VLQGKQIIVLALILNPSKRRP